MYIEQAYKGNAKLWKYAVLPAVFLGFVLLNYISTRTAPVPVEETIQQLIAQWGSNTVLLLLLAPLALGLFTLWGWTYLVHQQSITALTTARSRVDYNRIFFAFTLWAGLTGLLTAVSLYFSPEDYVLQFQVSKFIPLALIALLFIPLQTSFEEYFFRGYLMQGLGLLAKNRWLPLLVTSLLFGAVHLVNPEVEKLGQVLLLYYIGSGLFLGVITLMDEGLELALGFHAANNLIMALLVTADWTAFQTHSIYKDISEPTTPGWEIFVPIVVLFPLLLLLFAKKYGWKNWKEKLFGKVPSKTTFTALTHDEFSRA